MHSITESLFLTYSSSGSFSGFKVVKDSSLKGSVAGEVVVVVGAGVVLERTFLKRVLKAGALVRIGREVALDEERGVTSRLLENLDRLRNRDVFLEEDRAVVRLGVWVGVVTESSSDEEFLHKFKDEASSNTKSIVLFFMTT